VSERRSFEQVRREQDTWLQRFAERERRAADRAETAAGLLNLLTVLWVVGIVVTILWLGITR
jgi:hypothetical protein